VKRLGRAVRRRRRAAAVPPGQLELLFDAPVLTLAPSDAPVVADGVVEEADADAAPAPAPAVSPTAPAIRLALLETLRDAYGDPRPALLIPGRPTPAVFDDIAAALAAKAHLEAAAR
jgi:hypothetical protein